MAESRFLSREDLLGGRLSIERRGSRTLSTIEARVSHMRAETGNAVRALFSGTETTFSRTFGDDYLRSLTLSARFVDTPGIAEIERFARQWRVLVPDDAEVRAALIHAFITRYSVSPSVQRACLEVAGYGDPLVAAAYQRIFGHPLDESAFPPAADQPEKPDSVSADPEAAAIAQAEEALEWLSVPAGTAIMREGDQPDHLYFVVSGRLRVTSGQGETSRVIADLGRGELIGEMGVLTGEVRTATVTAMRDSEVVRLPQDAVLRMVYQSPRMLMRMNQVLAQRLRVELAAGRREPSPQMTISIIPMGPGVPIRELTQKLLEALAPLGSVCHINSTKVEEQFPRLRSDRDPWLDGELHSWLSEQEARNQYVIYEAPSVGGGWTDLCIRQADRVVLVAAPGSSPATTDAEQRVSELNVTARRELVLLRESINQRPTDTRHWLQPRQVFAHHNVVLSEPSHIGRLARRISGQAIGLVLSGGGVRGYVHVGAWRAIEEAGIEIDFVAGTSVGAIMASGMATDRTADQIEELGNLFAHAGIKDVTLPLVSFFRSREITNLLRRYTNNIRIEDLWRPFFCISTSLSKAEPVIHSSGPLWLAARASSAIPGLFSPVPTPDGDLLVDGGIMNNVPIDVMRGLCERGPVIAINLSAHSEKAAQYNFGPSLSGWRVLRSRFNPFEKTIQAPSIFTTLLRTTEAGSIHRMRTGEVLGQANLLITPPVQQYRLLDFGSTDALIRLGYETTAATLKTWLDENPSMRPRLGLGRPG